MRAIDPQTQETYVLVKSEIYERLQGLLTEEEEWQKAAYLATMKIFGRDGWDDPAMDVYNELDPRRQP